MIKNGESITIPDNKATRRKRTGYHDGFYFISPQETGNISHKILRLRLINFVSQNQSLTDLPFTMTPEMVKEAALRFKPKVIYLYHYRGTDPQLLINLLKGAPEIEARVRKM